MNILKIQTFLDKKNVKYKFEGSVDDTIIGYSSIFHYKEDTVTWLRNEKILEKEKLEAIKFKFLITGNDSGRIRQAKSQLWVDNPKEIFFNILDEFWGEERAFEISKHAIIEDGSQIGKRTSIGPFTYISSKASIGDGCIIGSNVSILGRVKIGNNCIIQSGAVLGEDGFGFIKQNNSQKFVKHYGGVLLADNVHIGSNTCVCRGAIDDTYIGEHTKIDNLCHIAHNVEIGKRCLVIAGTIIMGSVRIGDDCWISTSVIRDLRQVGNNSVIGMGAVVVKDVQSEITVLGNPAKVLEK